MRATLKNLRTTCLAAGIAAALALAVIPVGSADPGPDPVQFDEPNEDPGLDSPVPLSAQRHEALWSRDAGGNGHVYGLTPRSCWQSAEAFAVALGGHLVTIDDAAENEFLRTTFLPISAEQEDLWIGLISPTGDVVDTANWIWTSGSAAAYRNWRAGQPDDQPPAGPNDRYAAMNFRLASDGTWDNYYDCWWRRPRGIYELENGATALPVPDFDTGWRRCVSRGEGVMLRHDLDIDPTRQTIKTLFRKENFVLGGWYFRVGVVAAPREVHIRRNAVFLVPQCDRTTSHFRLQIWTHM